VESILAEIFLRSLWVTARRADDRVIGPTCV
jgi:hypothetical protein